MNIHIVSYDEGSFIIANDIEKEQLKGKEISLAITPILKYRKEDNVVGAYLNISYSLGDKQILNYGGVLSLYVGGWKELSVSEDFNDDSARQFLKPVWEYTLAVIRGILIEKTKTTLLSASYLPYIDIDQFVAAVKFEDISNEEAQSNEK